MTVIKRFAAAALMLAAFGLSACQSSTATVQNQTSALSCASDSAFSTTVSEDLSVVSEDSSVVSEASSAAAAEAVDVKKLSFTKTSITLEKGGTYAIKAKVSPSNAALKWKSSDKTVATVNSNGLVTAVKAGKCKITAVSQNGKEAACTVKVTSKSFHASKLSKSSQIIVVTVESMNTSWGKFKTYEKADGSWSLVMNVSASIGAQGMIYDADRVEGDNKTPSGIYDLSYAFGWAQNPGTKMTYKLSDNNSYYDENSDSPNYNLWVESDPGGNCEWMGIPEYKYGVVIDFNPQRTPKKGSGIFIHIRKSEDSTTAGCVALDEDNIVSLLQWLDPDKNPMILICTNGDLSKYYY